MPSNHVYLEDFDEIEPIEFTFKNTEGENDRTQVTYILYAREIVYNKL